MKLAAIASEDVVFQILEAARAVDAIELESFWTPIESLRTHADAEDPEIELIDDWSSILSDSSIDGVIVAGSSEPILTASRHLIQAGKRLLIATKSADPTSVFAFTALWQEFPERITPLFFSDVRQVTAKITDQLPHEKLGKLRRVEFVRTLDQGTANGLEFSEIKSWLLQDLSWLHRLAPEATQVTMSTSDMGDPSRPEEARVILTGENAIELRWTMIAEETRRWFLGLIGENGRPQISQEGDGPIDLDHSKFFDLPTDPATISADLAGQLQSVASGFDDSNWAEVIKLGEIGAAAERSLAKRRTISVQFEEASERSQFKTQMAAFGCGALLWAMFGMIAVLTIGSFIDPRDREYVTSNSAGFVLTSDEFDDESGALKESAKPHLVAIAKSWSSTSPVVIIESEDSGSMMAKTTQASVVEALAEEGVQNSIDRIVVRPIPGKWFETVMRLGWAIVFLPIGLVLIAQLLIVVARPLE